jgi:hypothetical protein
MGIYIKNLQKPESCAVCFFRPCGTNYCELLDRNYVDMDKYCPLLEIKTPHGRLIDADEMQEWISLGGLNPDCVSTVIERED